MIVADDDRVCVVKRVDAAEVLQLGLKREANEVAKRARWRQTSLDSTPTTCVRRCRRWGCSMSECSTTSPSGKGIRCMWMRGGTSKGGCFL